MGLVERALDRAIRRRPHLRFLTARGGAHAEARDGEASEPAETPPAPRPAPAALSRPDRRRLVTETLAYPDTVCVSALQTLIESS